MSKNSNTATADMHVTDGAYGDYDIARIRISPDNRKRFNEAALQELAASIKSIGIAQPILIRLVTPTADAPEDFEIVAGERRYRASIIAGRTTIPAVCRRLSDLDAAKLRILENLQREDPHPIEEAEGFQMLMLQHGYSADQLAEEISKSRAYVYARLKLCALTLEVRDQVLDGKVDASTALLVARIPVPALQVRAMTEILEGYREQPMSYREAVAFTQERYMLDLNKAEFDVGDAKLVVKAGACSTCPKRAGNQPEVFVDVSADVCTDPDCFKEKRAAHVDRVILVSGKKGVPTFDSVDALQAHDPNSLLVQSDGYINYMERFVDYANSYKSIISKLNAANTPPTKAYLHTNGKLVPIFERAAVQAALEEIGVCRSVSQLAKDAAKPSETAPNAKRLAQMKAEAEALRTKEAIAQQETSFRVSLYKQFRTRAANGLSLQSLREFVKLVLTDDNSYSLPDDIRDVYGLESYSDVAVAAHIDQATLPEVQLILIDLVLGECLYVEANDVEEDGTIDDDDYCNGQARIAALLSMASHEGIDPDQVKEAMFPTPINVANMQHADLVKFIETHPSRINELKDAVLADQTRANLVSLLEVAANGLGYVYGVDGFQLKPAEAIAPVSATTESSDLAPQPEDGDAVAVDGEDLEAAMAEPAPTKKAAKAKPATKKISVPSTPAAAPKPTGKGRLAPVAAWPFPKSSKDALPPAAITNSTAATPSTQEAK